MKKDNLKKLSLQQQIQKSIHKDAKIEELNRNILGNELSIFYIETLIDKKLFSSSILSKIDSVSSNQIQDNKDIIDVFFSQIITTSSVEKIESLEKCLDKILIGNVVVVCKDSAISIPVFSPEKRGVEEPPTSRVIKGPREGFVEEIFTNLNLVRKRLKTTNIRLKDFFVGKQTKTQVTIVYLEGIAQKDIVSDIAKRIEKIDIDGIIDSYYIESFLEDNKIKFFKRIGNTEKPDVFCARILEGRIGILVDGSPIALTAPYVLFEDLQSSQDYYTIPSMASFARIMRIFGLVFAILAPGTFVALQSYNYRILPINFLITLLSSIEGLSIPPLIEILVVLLLFEIITEASLRMPNSLGMALSIIGALALGNTAVDAGIISPPSIVVVAISSVAIYIIPDQISETRILRLIFTTLGGIIGLYGITMAFIILTTYMCSIKSFGIPYFTPIAPFIKSDQKDAFLKQPIQDMKERPRLIASKNNIRQKNNKIKNMNYTISDDEGGEK